MEAKRASNIRAFLHLNLVIIGRRFKISLLSMSSSDGSIHGIFQVETSSSSAIELPAGQYTVATHMLVGQGGEGQGFVTLIGDGNWTSQSIPSHIDK